ncbi:TauD/TfdA dioxygenase family protein [Sneathiella chinensis]|uniref:Alpha-ketoglutarate-dependent taurine dioxygenase n=1 Tax=Sneathiella chinensis TaxID=349750 RepID=A0ABQ5U6V3_9PROT|nr:TauD/TfdA family dioxygenase [Sneathiella chinensis]GLQ07131.1 alpha-ketoglutarate-dependent taurine dioxygenase [Sneathiella chinensis]
MPSDFTHFQVTPANPTIGGHISGIDLNADLSDDVYAELKAALHRYKVIFFRNQDLSTDKYLKLGQHFGELENHEFFPSLDGVPEIQVITAEGGNTGVDRWHADVTFRPNPSAASILRARDIPPIGGDTMWLCSNAAFRGLSEPLQELVLKLEAIHDMRMGMTGYLDPDVVEKNARENPPRRHPAVIAHPVTGAPLLFVNSIWTSGFAGLSKNESDMLLQLLMDHVKSPEYQVRFKWEVNSIAIWDNLATQHYALGDYSYRRVMNRMVVGGIVPEAYNPAKR